MLFDWFISNFPKYGLVDLTWLIYPEQDCNIYSDTSANEDNSFRNHIR